MVVLVAAYAAAMRVEFEAGPGYTVPTVLVLVPMLYLLPPALVPLCVVAAHLLGFLINVALGRRHIARMPVVLGQGWHAIGPALVFTLGSPGAASWDDGPLVLAPSPPTWRATPPPPSPSITSVTATHWRPWCVPRSGSISSTCC